MDDEKKTGGQAYPAAWGNHEQGGNDVPGMSLRDWFAGQALMGIASIQAEGFSLCEGDAAKWAYTYADAMIEARKDTPNDA